jgi:serine/threonine-protein kinase ULK4
VIEPVLKSFTKDLVSALSYLHANGIVYCDLKPGNILLNEYSNLKLCDFGLSQRLVDLVQGEEVNPEAERKGTPYYMAPELFDQGGVFSFAADVYALGAVLYELASGKTPFSNENFTELVKSICEGEPRKLTNVSDDCSQFILSLLDKNPATRPKWRQICSHKWWGGVAFETYQYPEESHFEKYIRDKGLDRVEPEKSMLLKEGLDTSNILGNTLLNHDTTGITKEENLLRLSLNVKKNITRETGDYMDTADDHQDIRLDKNMTINLGKNNTTHTISDFLEEAAQKSQENISPNEDQKSKASPVLKSLRSHKSFE